MEENCYQILGVHPRASQEVIEAAYRRLKRVHRTDYLPDAVDAGPEPNDPYLARIEHAYWVLSDAVRRSLHDEELEKQRTALPVADDLATARQQFMPSGAWLAHQRRENGSVYVRVGWAADFTATQQELESRIPAAARSYDPHLNEWRVDAGYDDVLADIFENYERPDAPPPVELPRPIYPRREFTPSRRKTWEPWTGWPFVIIGGLMAAIALTLLFPVGRAEEWAAEATATAAALIDAAPPLESHFPTSTPAPPPMVILQGSPRYPSVHLRAGPGTDTPSLTLLNGDQEYWIIGRTVDRTWLVVATPDQVGWAAEWTFAVEGDLGSLAVFQADAPLPEKVPTPTPVIDRVP